MGCKEAGRHHMASWEVSRAQGMEGGSVTVAWNRGPALREMATLRTVAALCRMLQE